MFSDKCPVSKNITIVEGEEIISDDKDVVETFSDFFENAVKNLGIEENSEYIQSVDNIDDPVEAAIHKFRKHPSIIKIKEIVEGNMEEFHFKEVELAEIGNEILALNVNKATTFKNIPPKIIKRNVDICTPYLKNILNSSFQSEIFPDELKLAPIFKTVDATSKTNYRPVSVLPTVSKIFERVMQDQIGGFMKNIFLSICVDIEKVIMRSMHSWH